MNEFSWLDWAIVVGYLVGVALFGLFKGGKPSSAHDYFLSEKKIHWLVVAFSIVATETSALTFLSVPGIAYRSNWQFLQLALGYVIGRTVVAFFFLPRYYEGRLSTVYAILETRFGVAMRKLASVVFIITRVFADGVRLYAAAIPLVAILRGYHLFSEVPDTTLYASAIVLIALATLVYVLFGGVRAVIWTDLLQLVIYLLGGLLSVVLLLSSLPAPAEALERIAAQGKFEVFNFKWENFFFSPYQFFLAVVGGAFLSMASHGADYIIVQRLFATDNLQSSQKALIASGAIVLVQFALFLLIGSLLYVFYNGAPFRSDEVFSKFIISGLPAGVSGLVVAALLAAAMSTLSSAINAIASSTVFDLYAATEKGRTASPEKKLRLSKIVSLVWSGVLTLSAVSYLGLGQSVVEVALSIASFTYGGLLGVFFLSLFQEEVDRRAAMVGFLASIVAMTAVVTRTTIAWTLYTLIGLAVTLIVAPALHRFFKARKKSQTV
ncbi:MAG: sodium:solute symporter [Chloroherpetonaceae bacterium]|nr:sodium:solute symporter [Chloroherpetonaceae bacterium]MCS7211907.1 sodium:solute symporter [Chloroherpetonaceae bacterium]MDW8020525.1 sodium:solute symporter [Chloroherpetonaceae bacterium]MDW8466203.1 sodium:solute symporter [Chloroherpetonaceae bacterium]